MFTVFVYDYIDMYNISKKERERVEVMGTGRIYGYMRVSTQKESQKTDRQRLTLEEYAKANSFEFYEIVEERVSGTVKADNRAVYGDLRSKMREGDILVVTDLDRLGRSADDTMSELRELRQEGIKVIALDIPYLNEWEKNQDDSMYRMIVDIMITLKSHMAEQERAKTVERINQGLDVARAKGKTLGRPQAQLEDDFIKEYKKYLNGGYGEMTKTNFAKMLGIGRSTLYKYIKLYEER